MKFRRVAGRRPPMLQCWFPGTLELRDTSSDRPATTRTGIVSPQRPDNGAITAMCLHNGASSRSTRYTTNTRTDSRTRTQPPTTPFGTYYRSNHPLLPASGLPDRNAGLGAIKTGFTHHEICDGSPPPVSATRVNHEPRPGPGLKIRDPAVTVTRITLLIDRVLMRIFSTDRR